MSYDTPTEETYKGFQEAYSYLNGRLFRNELPDCLITMQRTSRSYGYFCRRRFVNRNGIVTDEIALNPRFFAARSELVFSRLSHTKWHTCGNFISVLSIVERDITIENGQTG